MAARPEKVYQINMLSNIVQSLRVWVRRLWRRRTHSANKKANSYPFSEPQVPARESPEVPQEPTSPAKCRQRKPDTDSLESDHATEVADNAEEENPQAGLGAPYSADAKSDGDDHKTVSDSRDAADEEPIDQPIPNDNELAESASATDSDQSGQVPTEIEPGTPVSDGSEKSPSDPLEDVRPEPDSPSAQPVEDHGNAPNINADGGGSSQPDLTDPLPEPPKRAEPPEDNALNDNSDPPEDKRKKRNRSQKPPRRIGGRRNGPTQPPSPANDDAKDKLTFTPRPELICRKSPSSWQWEVVLSAEDECNIVEVRRDGDPLSAVSGEYSLSSLAGSLSIDYEDRESDQLPLFDGAPLIFKMPNDWNGDGRKVGGITSGHFIVMVPREWKRTGSAPVEPEECTDANFTAHFFYIKKGKVAGDVGGFEDCDLALTTTGFELDGDRVFDDCEDGELFVGAPPSLCPTSDIVWARIGEEREDGWKGENFKPADQSLAEVLNGRQGRFFVRVYDGDAKLLDSGEFRYLRDLREIRVNDEPYSAATLLVPPSTGYSLAEVQFVSADGTTIHPNLDISGTHATMQSGGILIVEPHPDGDHISCALQSGADRVDTVIKLPRIWWRMEQDDGEANEWHDMPLAMTRQQFREHADADAAVRLRLPLCVSSVKVGFDEELYRTYRSQKNGDNTETEIRLSDFIDYDQIDQRLNENSSLSIRCGEAVLQLIRVSADPVPTIISFTCEPATIAAGEMATLRWTAQNAEPIRIAIDPDIGSVKSNGSITVTLSETTVFTLRLTTSGTDEVTKAVSVVVRPRSQIGIDKSAIKKQIKALKVKREAALQARDKKCLKEVRRQIRRLKRKIRKSTSDPLKRMQRGK